MNSVRGVKGFVSVPVADRFWPMVEKGDGCWLWLGTKRGERPYGMFWMDGHHRPAHAVAWELAHGEPFPAGMDACHHCDNPPCVRPDHIFPGTPSDNAKDAVRKGRVVPPLEPHREFCKRGHRLEGGNLWIDGRGGRHCRPCKLEHHRQSRIARAALAPKEPTR